MAQRRPPRTPPSGPDGDGVRVVSKPHRSRRMPGWAVAAVIAAVAAVAWFVLVRGPGPDPNPAAAPVAVDDARAGHADGPLPSARPSTAASAQEPPEMRSNDPDDLAAYFLPGDPEPSGAEVITALQEAGVHTGLGAFNPPGTSPPLEGLAVPDDFPLPEGYVRHHQVTDAGVPIEPILMFSPDFTLFDAQGRRIAMPANRVVPPGLAPPDLPRRWVRLGKP